MNLTPTQVAADIFYIDRQAVIDSCCDGGPGFELPPGLTLTDILESRDRVKAQRKKAMGAYAETERNEILRDVDALVKRCKVAEADRDAAEAIMHEEMMARLRVEWNYIASNLIAWVLGAMTLLNALYAFGWLS